MLTQQLVLREPPAQEPTAVLTYPPVLSTAAWWPITSVDAGVAVFYLGHYTLFVLFG